MQCLVPVTLFSLPGLWVPIPRHWMTSSYPRCAWASVTSARWD
jgi:hypothetical protein